MPDKSAQLKEDKRYKIMGITPGLFAIITVVVLAATYMEVLPTGMIGAFPLMIVLGAILNEIGNKLPIVKDYLGGGPIVVIFASAALVTYGLLPASSVEIMTNFMVQESFLDFYIAALITGSILGMDRDLLVSAAVRYLPVIVGGVVVAFTLTGLVGGLMGYGVKDAILYISLPIMGGGMGAGAVPLSQMFATGLNVDPTVILSKMVPALALGNAIAIILAGLLSKLAKGNPRFSGEGKLMRNQEDTQTKEKEEEAVSYSNLGMGLLFSTVFFVFGAIAGDFIPIHSYALMIITVVLVKSFGLFPSKYEVAAAQWFKFVMSNLTPALLIGIGVAYTDLAQVIDALSITYVVLVSVAIIGAAIGAGFVGHLFGFYPLEAAITGGLCMANMGGTGDVAVLSAADRMELMPFSQISSRLGGAFMLIVATVLLRFLA